MTIRDVAAATGLSPAAVSYAMRGVQTSPETQERVRRVAEDLGYTGNAVARALARGHTGLVGVLSGSLEDLGEQRFVETLGRELGRRDLHMVVADARGEPDRERTLARQLAEQLVDGLVVSPLDPSDSTWEEIGDVLPIGDLLDQVAEGAGVDVTFTWTDQEFLADQKVEPWAGDRSVPLWLPRPEYAGMLAHDFRGPMTVIRGYAELLRDPAAPEEVTARAAPP